MIKLYIINSSDGSFLYEDAGSIDSVTSDLDDNRSFTLYPPPESSNKWRWIDSKWTTDDTA